MNTESNSPSGLPLFVSGWGAGNILFNDPKTFWDDASRVASEGVWGENLDAAMSGKSAPRVWVFLHEPGEGHLSAASALSVARELALRDQAVLLLDADDEHPDLTRWAERTEQDGWIDFIRYGSSVLNCGIPMPFEGRRGYLLGVGSFSPVDVSRMEVAELLVRLKRQTDDILIVAPANSVGKFWAAEADLRLLCWDRAHRSPGLVEGVLEGFSAAGVPVSGLVGFGLPVEEPARDEDPILKSEEGGLATEELLEESLPENEEPSKRASAVLSELEEQEDDGFQEEEEFARRKGNSGVFWMVAVASVVLISAASVYYLKYLRVPAEGNFPVVAQQETVQGGAAQFDSGFALLSKESLEQEMGDVAGEQLPDSGEQPIAEEVLVSEVVDPAPVETEKLPDEPQVSAPENAFFMDPYLAPAGNGGWTLHVYSFPDSVQAEAECRILAAKGFQTATRAVQIKDKGRWYRLYLGSFETKTEAKAARAKLLKELGEDWANPVRF